MELPESCAGCGRCCYPFVPLLPEDTHIPEEWVETRQVGARTFRVLKQVPDENPAYAAQGYEHCLLLDPVTKLCRAYDQRPKVCRDFERGSTVCLQMLGEFQKAGADLGPL